MTAVNFERVLALGFPDAREPEVRPLACRVAFADLTAVKEANKGFTLYFVPVQNQRPQGPAMSNTSTATLQRPIATPAAPSLLRELFEATPLYILMTALSSAKR